MSAPFEELSNLDRLVHEPARLSILTALSSCDTADFVFLQSLTGLNAGNLVTHLTRLEDAGLVEIEKGFIQGKKGPIRQTSVRLTKSGRSTIDEYWTHLETLRKATKRWKSAERSRMILAPRTS